MAVASNNAGQDIAASNSCGSVGAGFKKAEHLYGEAAVARIFRSGHVFMAYPVRLFFLPSADSVPVRCMMVAPKRKLRHAVDRNRVKRLLREAYRLNKQKVWQWCCDNNMQLHLAMVYVADSPLPQNVVCEKISAGLCKLLSKLSSVAAAGGPSSSCPAAGEPNV